MATKIMDSKRADELKKMASSISPEDLEFLVAQVKLFAKIQNGPRAIQSVEVQFSSKVVAGITFVWTDGKKIQYPSKLSTSADGKTTDSDSVQTFAVPAEQFLMEIEVKASKDGVHAVQFMTNRFMLSGYFGTAIEGAESFFFDATKGNMIVGLVWPAEAPHPSGVDQLALVLPPKKTVIRPPSTAEPIELMSKKEKEAQRLALAEKRAKRHTIEAGGFTGLDSSAAAKAGEKNTFRPSYDGPPDAKPVYGISADVRKQRREAGAAERARIHCEDAGGFKGLTATEASKVGDTNNTFRTDWAAVRKSWVEGEAISREEREQRRLKGAAARAHQHMLSAGQKEFAGLDAATAKKVGLEMNYGAKGVEVVVPGATSLQEAWKTHHISEQKEKTVKTALKTVEAAKTKLDAKPVLPTWVESEKINALAKEFGTSVDWSKVLMFLGKN